MAKFLADDAFDISKYDFNWYDRNFYEEILQRGLNERVDGVTYRDWLVVNGFNSTPEFYDDYYLTFAGSNITGSVDRNTVSGTVTLMYEASADRSMNFYSWWGLSGISLSASTISAAARTQTTTDDVAIFASALRGDDNILMSDYNDKMRGFAGNDMMNGHAGNDTLYGDAGNDRVSGDAGNDTLYGGTGNDTLVGAAGTDRLVGDAGRDVLVGGAGKDSLLGGADADTFRFIAMGDMATTATTADVIQDFRRGTDKIDLSAIDASTLISGNGAFTFDGTAAHDTSTQGDVYYKQFNNAGTTNDYTLIYIDTDADRASEGVIRLTGLYALTASDFIL